MMHAGINKTFAEVRVHYRGVGQETVTKLVEGCNVCQLRWEDFIAHNYLTY